MPFGKFRPKECDLVHSLVKLQLNENFVFSQILFFALNATSVCCVIEEIWHVVVTVVYCIHRITMRQANSMAEILMLGPY